MVAVEKTAPLFASIFELFTSIENEDYGHHSGIAF
jgi:hypothetical protein